MSLSNEEKARYTRHIVLPEIGERGQERLKAARVLIVGVGGLGSPAALYLAASGVGTIGLMDADTVDLSNLQRQIIYGEGDVGIKKSEAAWSRLHNINRELNIKQHSERVTAKNALTLIQDYDIILDGTDNFAAHYILNDACVLADKVLVYGNVYRFEGQIGVVRPKRGPCYRCLYPEPPPSGLAPSCADAGVLGVIPGIIGSMQALEVLKIILDIGQPVADRILRFDGLGTGFREIKASRDLQCRVCGEHPSLMEVITSAEEPDCFLASEITSDKLQEALRSGSPPFLLDVRDIHEYEARHLEGAILIPLSVLSERLHELDLTREIVVYCHSGVRSARALHILQSHGYQKVKHLKGGIVAMTQAGHGH